MCVNAIKIRGVLTTVVSSLLLSSVWRGQEGLLARRNRWTSDRLPKSSSLQNCLENVKEEFWKSGQFYMFFPKFKLLKKYDNFLESSHTRLTW